MQVMRSKGSLLDIVAHANVKGTTMPAFNELPGDMMFNESMGENFYEQFQNHVYETKVSDLNVSEERVANMKSSTYFTLSKMINHIDVFREQFVGGRVPKYEQMYVTKRKDQTNQARAQAMVKKQVTVEPKTKVQRLNVSCMSLGSGVRNMRTMHHTQQMSKQNLGGLLRPSMQNLPSTTE